MLGYAAVLLAASVVLGAEGRAKQDDLQKLRVFRGNWEATDVEFEGQTLRVPVSWRPILEGRFIEHKYVGIDGRGNVTGWGLVVIGRDPADDKLKCWGFDNEGGFMPMTLTGWEGDKCTWDTMFVEADGTERRATTSFELLDKNSYRWELSDEDGEKHEATFKRTRRKKDSWPQPRLEMPEGVSEQLKDLEGWTGDFIMEGRDAFTGKTSVGQTTCGWILDGKFMLYDNASINDDLSVERYRAIVGVDPATDKTTGWEFDSLGTVGKYTVSNKGHDIVGKAMSLEAGLLEYEGKMSQTEDGFEYHAAGKLPQDKEVSYFMVWKNKQSGEE
jgi:hypothetical protein